MTLGELCFHLRNRPGMYLPDGRYVTAVAFVEGFNTALDGEPLRGFQPWMVDRLAAKPSGLYWAYVLASTRVAGVNEGQVRLDQLPPGQDQILVDDLVRLIDEFRNDRSGAEAALDHRLPP